LYLCISLLFIMLEQMCKEACLQKREREGTIEKKRKRRAAKEKVYPWGLHDCKVGKWLEKQFNFFEKLVMRWVSDMVRCSSFFHYFFVENFLTHPPQNWIPWNILKVVKHLYQFSHFIFQFLIKISFFVSYQSFSNLAIWWDVLYLFIILYGIFFLPTT